MFLCHDQTFVKKWVCDIRRPLSSPLLVSALETSDTRKDSDSGADDIVTGLFLNTLIYFHVVTCLRGILTLK